MSDLVSPFEQFREQSPYVHRNAANSSRVRDELVGLLRERAAQIRPSPIDAEGQHAALLEFIAHVAGIYDYDARLLVLSKALAINDGAIAGEMRAIIGGIRKGTDPAVAFNDLVCAAFDDATFGALQLRQQLRAAQERAEQAEREAAAEHARVAGLEAERDEQHHRVIALQSEIDRGKSALRFADVAEPEPGQSTEEKPPPNVREHGSGWQPYKKFNGSPKQWQGAIWPTIAEAVAELDNKVSEMGKQAADERLQRERGIAA
jgi:hypothetical protein